MSKETKKKKEEKEDDDDDDWSIPESFKDDTHYDNFVEDCFTQLVEKNAHLVANYGLGTHERWDVKQSTGELIFSDKNIKKLTCNVDFLGSYSYTYKTWLWGWANGSIDEYLTQNVKRVQEFGKLHDDLSLSQKGVDCEDENHIWNLSAIACKVLNGVGVYKGPTTNSNCIMMMIKSIKKHDDSNEDETTGEID